MKGIVYYLHNEQGYVGSTFDLNRRISEHKKNCKMWLKDNTKDYCSSYKVIKNSFEILILAEVEIESKKDLEILEQFYIDTFDCVNERKACQTPQGRKEYNKIFMKEHKEEKKIYMKEYNEKHKDEKKIYMKERYEENKEEINQKKKERYEKNKEEINQKKKEKIICECGSEVRVSDKARHYKSIKHQSFLNL